MVKTNNRRLPVGIQSFEEMRKEGYLYVDKTDIIWQLANEGKKYNYLSRPRRFGKSVLVDTSVSTRNMLPFAALPRKRCCVISSQKSTSWQNMRAGHSMKQLHNWPHIMMAIISVAEIWWMFSIHSASSMPWQILT